MEFLEKSNQLKKFAILKLYVNTENHELVDLYKSYIEKHNNSIKTDLFPNSGFDIFFPKEKVFDLELYNIMINMDIKCEMIYYDKYNNYHEPSPFYIFPRSSMSKTPLILSNHTGIIDSGYRGWIIGAFKWINDTPIKISGLSNEYKVNQFTRLLQICHPTLCPILVELVEESNLSKTLRGDGSFGSTGLFGL